MTAIVADGAAVHGAANARLVARLERLPVTPRLMLIRAIVGIATFFDGYTVLAIAFAMPSLVSEWKLTPTEVGLILSAGYVGQLFGAVIFGSMAEKFGRLKTLFITIVLFVSMDISCLFACDPGARDIYSTPTFPSIAADFEGKRFQPKKASSTATSSRLPRSPSSTARRPSARRSSTPTSASTSP